MEREDFLRRVAEKIGTGRQPGSITELTPGEMEAFKVLSMFSGNPFQLCEDILNSTNKEGDMFPESGLASMVTAATAVFPPPEEMTQMDLFICRLQNLLGDLVKKRDRLRVTNKRFFGAAPSPGLEPGEPLPDSQRQIPDSQRQIIESLLDDIETVSNDIEKEINDLQKII